MASSESDADDEDLAERERRVAFLERVAASHDRLRDCIAETALWQSCPGAYRIDAPMANDDQAAGAIADFVRRAIKVVKFFNQVCGPKKGWDRDSDGMHALAVTVQAGFLRDKSPYRAGRERLYEWESAPAAVAAASITVHEAADHGKQHGPECDLAPKAVEWYAAIVAYRRRLLDIETLAYLAGVEAVAHPNLAPQAHAAVIKLASTIRSLETVTGAMGEWANVVPSLMKAIQDASVFSRGAPPGDAPAFAAPKASEPGASESESGIPAPDQPTGLKSVAELVQAFGIPKENVEALKKRLQRERSRLYADAVRELREPRSHKPKFLYDAGHEEVRKIMADYVE
jgi:hypothetical protein